MKGVFGIVLCGPCSGVLHKGATRNFHVLEDVISSSSTHGLYYWGWRIKLWGIKLPRHLEQKHYIEVEVRKALAFPKKSKERHKALLEIQNLVDYNHNCRSSSKGSGVRSDTKICRIEKRTNISHSKLYSLWILSSTVQEERIVETSQATYWWKIKS